MTTSAIPRRQSSARLSIIEFVRPDQSGRYSLEQAFQLLSWMARTGENFTTPNRWTTATVGGRIGCYNATNNCYSGVTSHADLSKRIQRGVFGAGIEMERWREDVGLNAYATLTLNFLHYKPFSAVPHLGFQGEASIAEALKKLFGDPNKNRSTAVSLNSIHYDATAVHGVEVAVSAKGFSFELKYGFHWPAERKELGDSEWTYILASTAPIAEGTHKGKPEPFLDTLHRALKVYDFVMDRFNGHLTTNLSDDMFVPKSSQPALTS